jgi:hypothetical protein
MTVILPCALESCTEDFKEKFKEVVAAVARVEADKVSMDFVSDSELKTSTRIDIRVGVPPQQDEAVVPKSTNNAVWNVVKHLKENTAHSVVVDTKYTHVCVAPITASEAGELGADVDSDGNSLW